MVKIVSMWHDPDSCVVHYILPNKTEFLFKPEKLGDNLREIPYPYIYVFVRDLPKIADVFNGCDIRRTVATVFPFKERQLVAKIAAGTPEKIGELTKKIEERQVKTIESHIPYARRVLIDCYGRLSSYFMGGDNVFKRSYIDTEVDERDAETIIAFSAVTSDESKSAVGEECLDLIVEVLGKSSVVIGWNIEYDQKKIANMLSKRYGDDFTHNLMKRVVFYDLMEPYVTYRRQRPPAPKTWKLKDVCLHEFNRILPTAYDMGKKYYELFESDKRLLAKINLEHAKALAELDEKYQFSFIDEMVADEACVTMDKVYEKTLVWANLLRKRGVLVPGRALFDKQDVQGALILDPVVGLLENVYVFDIVSMYPMILKTVDIVGMSDAVKDLLEKRIQLKKMMKEAAKSGDIQSYNRFKAQQTALKVIINSAVGVMGRYGDGKNGLYYPEGISKVTAKGRMILSRLKHVLEEKRYGMVVYGDTDSIFIKFGGKSTEIFDWVKGTVLPELNTVLKEELGEDAEIEIDKVFDKIVFVTKKKYAAKAVFLDGTWLDSPQTMTVGLETVRGDWCMLAKNVLSNVIELTFAGKPLSYIMDVVSEYYRRMINKEYDQDLVLYRSLSRPVRSYKSKNIPHLRALKILKDMNEVVRVGDKISYVIVSCEKGKMKVEPVTETYFPVIEFS
ncbi:MAG: DNA polymerase domain-containing protein [Thermoproteota archaeon]